MQIGSRGLPDRERGVCPPRIGLFVGLLVLLVTGCASDRPDDGGDAVPADGWPAGSAWGLDPELTIGGTDEGPHLFGRLADIEVGRDGVIYALDAYAAELRMFSADGAHIATIGGHGEGPGEFTTPVGLAWLPGEDTLVVVDGAGGRYSLFGADGSFGRTVLRPIVDFSGAFMGGFSAGRFYDSSLLFAADGRVRQGLVGIDLAQPSTAPDTVVLPWPSPLEREYFIGETATGGGGTLAVPFAPFATWRVQRDGTIWWGFTDSYRAYRISLTGDTVGRISATAERVPVLPDEISAWAESSAATNFRERFGSINLDRIPAYKPAFSALFADPQGVLWVQVPTIDGSVAFDVFGRDASRMGRLYTPLTRTAPVRPRVRDDRLYVVGQDEYEVASIHVFRISGREPIEPDPSGL